MAFDLHSIYDSLYYFIFNDDPEKVERLGPFYIQLAIVIIYILFVKVIGPKLMKPYKPFKINFLLITFNVVIVSWNGYVSYNLLCLLIDGIITRRWCGLRNSEHIQYYVKESFGYIWLFFLSKYVDLLDTIFFVLRKKYRQISFLHVFHHGVVILLGWCGIYYKARGSYIGVICALNAFVHVCTYTYYFLTAFGPSVQKILNPRKKYLTFVQVGQFIVLLSYMVIGILTGCEDLDFMVICVTCFLCVLMVLFANFYVKNYKKD